MLARWAYEEEIRCRRKWLQGINTATDIALLWEVTGMKMTVAEGSPKMSASNNANQVPLLQLLSRWQWVILVN